MFRRFMFWLGFRRTIKWYYFDGTGPLPVESWIWVGHNAPMSGTLVNGKLVAEETQNG